MKKNKSMKKIILLSLLLALTMTKAFADEVAGFDGPTWYDYRADSYAGGNGNENNPYLISTPAQLAKLAYEVNVTDKNIQVATTDTMVVQTREANKREFFDFKYVKE